MMCQKLHHIVTEINRTRQMMSHNGGVRPTIANSCWGRPLFGLVCFLVITAHVFEDDMDILPQVLKFLEWLSKFHILKPILS